MENKGYSRAFSLDLVSRTPQEEKDKMGMKEGRSNPERIQDRPHSAIMIGSVQVIVAPENISPFQVDAIAFEEDTFLVLSADPEIFETQEASEHIVAESFRARPAEPGSVIVKGKYPYWLLAVVHDLNQEPSWKEEWVTHALDRIFQETEKRKLKSIAVPLLGTLHGNLEKPRFLSLLRAALERKQPACLSRLWLVVQVGTTRQILDMLRAELEE